MRFRIRDAEWFVRGVKPVRTSRILIADAVGLGETLEAGVLLLELISTDFRRVGDGVYGNLRQSAVREWQWATPLRTQLDRRQALLELDVIVTKALGLSLDDLLQHAHQTHHRLQSPVLQEVPRRRLQRGLGDAGGKRLK